MIFRGSLFSRELEMETWLTVAMPDSFHDQRPHKVIYMLHGLYGNSTDWSDNTMLPLYAKEYNVVFVMPEAGHSFYADMAYGQRYFSYVSRELPALCRNIFHISDKREDTAIMGLSMGGYGALKCALREPEQYWLCCAFSSGGLYLKDVLDLARSGELLPEEFKAVCGVDYQYKEEDDVVELARKVSGQAVKPVIHTTCGTEDFLYKDNINFAKEMQGLDFTYAYDEWKGDHNWYFWDESLRRMLKKYYTPAK